MNKPEKAGGIFMVIPKKLYSNLTDNIRLLKNTLPINKSFDIITREITLGSTSCFFIGLNGMCDLKIIQWLFADIESKDFQTKATENSSSLPQFVKDQFFYAQITFTDSFQEMIENLLKEY